MRKIYVLALIALVLALSVGWEESWTVYNDVRYGVTDDERADLYLHDHGIRPAMVMIHGGGWQSGDKTHVGGFYAKAYALAGFNVVAINYRLARLGEPSTQWPAQLQDAQLAVRWLRTNAVRFRIDSARIGAMGQSAGGTLALFLGSLNMNAPGDRADLYAEESPKVSAVIDAFGPSDFTQRDMADKFALSAVFGGREFDEALDLYRSASAINALTAHSAPACIVQGEKDAMIDPSQSRLLAERLRALNVRYEWLPFAGAHAYEGLTTLQRLAIEFEALRCVSRLMHSGRLDF